MKMNRVVRSVMLGLIMGVALTLGLLFWFVKANEDLITEKILRQLEQETTIQLTRQQIDLTLWEHFPNVSLSIRDVIIPQPADFNGSAGFDNMLEVEKIYVNTDLVPLLLQRISIKNIGIEGGRVNIERNSGGQLNLTTLFSAEQSGTRHRKKMNIDAFVLEKLRVVYSQESSGFMLDHFFEEGRLSVHQSSNEFLLHFDLDGSLQSIKNKNFVLEQIIKGQYKGTLAGMGKKWEVYDASVYLADMPFSVEGILNTDVPPEYEFVFSGDKLPATKLQPLLSKIGYELPEEINVQKGEVSIQGRLEALRPRPQMQILIDFSGSKLQLLAGDNELKNGFVKGRLSVNTATQKYRVEVSRSNFQSLGGTFTGNVLLTRERQRRISIALEGDMPLGSLLATFNSKFNAKADGLVYLNYHYDGLFPEKTKKMVLSKEAKISLKFLNNTVTLNGSNSIVFSNLKGQLLKGASLKFDSISGSIQGSAFLMNGQMKNPEFLAPENSKKLAVVEGLFKADSLNTNWFNIDKADEAEKQASKSNNSWLFPDDILGRLQVQVGAFYHQTFTARNIYLEAQYKPGMYTLRQVALETAQGKVRAGGVLLRKIDGSMAMRTQGDFNRLNIGEMFSSMNNFGQDYLRNDHLGGTVSGTLQMQTDLTHQGQIILPSLETHSKIRIDEGELIGFEPMMGLSKFIDVEELKHIKFSTLENQISIKDQIIHIPQMDINSTAFRITASGEHGFNHQFDYHLKVLLSDVLSSKFPRREKKEEAFGAIEDDGLGRTAVYLRLEGTPDDYEVSYDRQTAREVMRKRVQNEKKVLKDILNQEFGWFDKDTSKRDIAQPAKHKIEFDQEGKRTKKKKEKEKPVFNIVFEEDTTSKKK